MDKKQIVNTIKDLENNSKKRNFDESIELILSFKNLNLKNKEHRMDYTFKLPNPYTKKIKAAVFLKDKHLAESLKGKVDKVIFESEISKLSKKEAKKIADEFDMFLAEGPVMLTVGKKLGQVLSPRGKMPVVAPPNSEAIVNLINSSIGNIKISNKKNKNSVAIQTKIGKKSQENEKIAENVLSVYNSIIDKLPAGKQNIKSVILKTTMGSPQKVGDLK